jgi:hypothetical protein
MIRRLRDHLQYVRDCGYIQVGPLVFTTWNRHAAREWNAFGLGMQAGREGWIKGEGPKF